MVRNYKRIKEKGYTEFQLKQAVEDVKSGRMTSSQAAQVYGIPRTTINTRLYCFHEKAGRPTVFSSEFEERVAHNLHIMEKQGFPLTRKEASILISEYVRQNGIITPFKHDIPGKDWFHAFQQRNNLSIKKPQNVEIARRKACDPFIVYGYFEMLERVVDELDLKDKPKQIYNLDETSICNDPSKGKIIGQKGYKATRTTSGPGRNNTTILLAANACGDKIPPLIVFQGKYLWTQWLYANENVKTAYAVSDKGWMETTIFERYMRETFVPAIGPERPVLLIFDGHSTHVDLSVIEYAASQDITILKLPPHSSHILQPLDCSVMKPFKDKWEDEIIKWQRLHIGSKLPKNEFARIVTQIWDEMNPVIISNGFRKAGAYPIDRDTISKVLFDVKLYQKWENFNTQNKQSHLQDPVEIDYTANETTSSVPSLLILALKKINENMEESFRMTCESESQDKFVQHVPISIQSNKFNSNKTKTSIVKKYKKEIQNNIQKSRHALRQTEGVKQYGQQKKNQKETLKSDENGNKDQNMERIESKNVVNMKKAELKTYYKKDKPIKQEYGQNAKQSQHTLPEKNNIVTANSFPTKSTKHTPIKLQIPSRFQNIDSQSTLKILDVKSIPPVKKNQENISFEEILLQTIAKNDPPTNRKRRVNNSRAEILTYKHVLEQMKKEKAEKDVVQENKLKRKMAKDAKKKENNVQKKAKQPKKANIQKTGIKKRKLTKNKVSDSDSNSTGSYKSKNDSDDEDINAFYESILEYDRPDEEEDEKASENNFDTGDYNRSPKASTSKENSMRISHPKEGQFILAKFYSTKGKKTYKYVCQVEDVSDEKIVVLGLKSKKKQNTVFNIVENDISIIEYKDIVQLLPNPQIRGKDYVFPCKIEILEM